jgi:RNA polymerase sigma-70 factor, ECF subfamily
MNATQLSIVDRRMLDAADRAGRDESSAAVRPAMAFDRLLEEVWRANEARLVRLALGLGMASEQAADVLQDVYVAAMQKPPGITNESELLKWLFRVTVNRCHLEHRRHGRWQRLWSTLAGQGSGKVGRPVPQQDDQCDRRAVYGELKVEVERALAKLSEADRSLVVMRYFSELNSRQIGEITGLPEATVRGRLRAARRKLAEELAEWKEG